MVEMSRSKWLAVAAAAIGFALLASSVAWVILIGQASGPLVVPDAMVTFETVQGNATFQCEVAETFEERAEGLMDREELASDQGMLFVFEDPDDVTFWMKDTLIPLDIIFIAENGTVLNIAEAVPEPGVADSDLTLYPSAGPVLWVLEVNGGTCELMGIMPGDHVEIQLRNPDPVR